METVIVMSFYTYLYVISIIVSLLGGGMILRQQKNLSSVFFFLFTFFCGLWFFIYYLYFSGFFVGDDLLMVSRFGFWSGIPTVYSLFLSLFFYGEKLKMSVWYKTIGAFLVATVALGYLYAGTDLIIANIEHHASEDVYREVLGSGFIIHILLHATAFFLYIITGYFKVRRLLGLEKIRLKNVLLATFTLLISLLVLQLILPYFNIWIFEKEIIVIYAIYVISIFFTVRRYYFLHLGYGIGKVLLLVGSLALSLLAMFFIQWIFNFSENNQSYWNDAIQLSIVENTMTSILFLVFYSYLRSKLLGKFLENTLTSEINPLKKKISGITDIEHLNKLLEDEMSRIFGTHTAKIFLYNDLVDDEFQIIREYFRDKEKQHILIRDIVFLEQNKGVYSTEVLEKSIPKNIVLVIPLYNTVGVHIGFFGVGSKRFGEFFTLQEIELLKEFGFFLEIHLKYLRTYTVMQDLSENLDKKVAEKTIEYNDLINKQKEFISEISHEIKSPIASAVFQSDSIIYDVEAGKMPQETLVSELRMLNAQLIKTSGLLSRIFSVQYYDTHSVNLFREQVSFPQFIEHEIELVAHINDNIFFETIIDAGVGFVEIDKIQFQQVLNNLLDNALKFLTSVEDPHIRLKVSATKKLLNISIEDNGQGFEGIDPLFVFDKYRIGKKETAGLGMGLYLCKKIVEMHHGSIGASTSEELGGAKFTISIPLK